MEFEFDEDQRLLQRMVRETVARSRALPEEQLWATYLELGWLEAPPVELAIILEELGYAADPTPFLATATWFAPLAGRLPIGSGTAVFDGVGGSSSTRTGRTRSPCSPGTAWSSAAVPTYAPNGSPSSTRPSMLPGSTDTTLWPGYRSWR